MISPELLRRFPFFAQLTDAQLRTVAMISDVHEFSPNQIIFEENKSASCLFFVIEGCVDLCYHVEDETKKDHKCEVTIETICAGDPFGISSLIEPFQLQLTARSSDHSKAICINGQRLKAEFEKDPMLELALLRRMAKAAIERLHYTRIKLAASYV